LVATGSHDKKIKLFEEEHGRRRGKSLYHGEPVKTLSGAGSVLVSCGPCICKFWDLTSMTVVTKLPMSSETLVGASLISFTDIHAGQQYRVLTASELGDLKLWHPGDRGTGSSEQPKVLQSFQAKGSLGNLLNFAVGERKGEKIGEGGGGRFVWPNVGWRARRIDSRSQKPCPVFFII